MNPSTEGVTLPASVMADLLQQFDDLAAAGVSISAYPASQARGAGVPDVLPIRTFNQLCEQLERHFGSDRLREAGRGLGKAFHLSLARSGRIGLSPTPNQLFEELRRCVALTVNDPLRRGWEVLASSDQKVRLRLTQTFHCVLMEGLLQELLERSGAVLGRLKHARCTREGADYCEYEALWLKARSPYLSRARATPRPRSDGP